MTTLTGEDLFKYLNHLEQEVTKRQSLQTKDSLTHSVHGFMIDLVQAERSYLEQINPNKNNAMLSFSGNGLPSIESINADLEAMCKLTEDEFNVARTKREDKQPLTIDDQLHRSVSEKSWNNTLSTYNKDDISRKKSFSVEETTDGKFRLILNEKIYLNGIDTFCQEHPIMVRTGDMVYNFVWQQLFEESKQKFYVPNTEVVKSGNLPVLIIEEELFYNISKTYKLKRSRYTRSTLNGAFGTKKILPKNYQQLIKSGRKERVRVTKNILETLTEALGQEVILGKVIKYAIEPIEYNDKPLAKALNFSKKFEGIDEIPTNFIEDYINIITYRLFIKTKNEKVVVGKIQYILPYKRYFLKNKELEQIKLEIKGEAFTNSHSYLQACSELKRKVVLK